MKSQEVKPAVIVGVVFVIIGIVIIAIIASLVIALLSLVDVEDIWGTITQPYFLIVFGIYLGIPFVVCILPGYYLANSANKS